MPSKLKKFIGKHILFDLPKQFSKDSIIITRWNKNRLTWKRIEYTFWPNEVNYI